MRYLGSWLRRGRGATAVEYLVALILCVLVVLGVAKLFGTTIYEKFQMGDERISDMERKQRKFGSGGNGGGGNLVSANEGDDVNGDKQQNKAYVTRARNSKLDDLSAGDSQLSQEEQKRLMAKRLATNSASSSQMGSPQEQGGSAGSDDHITDPEMQRQQYALRGETPPEQFRFNPLILILIAMLLLGLGYMIVKGNKEEG